jgi:hypothetical protein
VDENLVLSGAGYCVISETTMKPQKNELNRREFLSTMTTAAGLLAIGLSPGAAAATEMESAEMSKAGKRVGISDEAYKNAWKRAGALVKP